MIEPSRMSYLTDTGDRTGNEEDAGKSDMESAKLTSCAAKGNNSQAAVFEPLPLIWKEDMKQEGGCVYIHRNFSNSSRVCDSDFWYCNES